MTQTHLKTRRWWNRRTRTLVWTTAGILLPLNYLAWHIFGWPAPIRISYETTRLTSPLTPDGYVDYLSVFRENLQMGSGDFTDDPWFVLFENERDLTRTPEYPRRNRPRPPGTENIVYHDPVTVFTENLGVEKPSIEDQQMIREFEVGILEQRMRVPFSAADNPLLASVIEGNKAWYDAVVNTYKPTPLPVQYPEATDPHGEQAVRMVLLPIHQHCRALAQRFRLRSMYRAGQGDLNGALDDMAFTWKMAARMDDCCLVSTSCATAIELHATPATIRQVLAASKLTPEFCSRIETLPQGSTFPALVKQLNEIERFMCLDDIQGLYAGRCDGTSWLTDSGIKFTGRLAKLKSRRFWHAVNWNQVLEEQNQYFDAAVAASRLPTWQEQQAAMEKLRNDPSYAGINASSEINSAPPSSVSDPTHLLQQVLLQRRWAWLGDPIQLAHLRDVRRRVVQIVARLAMWRQVHGQFPDDLQSILTVDGFSTARPELLTDPFTGSQLGYEKQLNGFVLSSVGPNMQKDGAGFEECAIHETDLSDRSRPEDDHIWRWPPAE